MTNTNIDLLTSLQINTVSPLRAVQEVRSLDFDEESYKKLVSDLIGRDVDFSDNYALQVAQYIVQDVVNGNEIDLEGNIEKAAKFVDSHPWINAEKKESYSSYKPRSTVDCLGNPKQKKGAKKAKAIKFWNENKGKFNSRKEWIVALMEAVDLSKAGASTYYHNLNTGIYS